MSNNEKVTEQNEQKIVTKYDRKIQQRKEQKEKAKREQRKSTIISVAVVVALVCLIASFPIRTYLAVNETYVTIGGEDVSRVEFDYSYNLAYNNYMNNYGSMLSYMGVNLTGDLSTQMYSEELSWKDFFDQMAVDNLTQTKAFLAEMKEVGFTYDTTEKFEEFETSVKNAAADAGVSVKQYVQTVYGPYATLDRIEAFVKNDITIGQFYAQKSEELTAGAEEVQAIYDNNPADYESVDYRLTSIQAELSEEPTEEEIAKAMEEAKKLAEAAEATVATDGELRENITKASVATTISDWLFDDTRKAGDTTVIEDTTYNQYYVLAFEKRYLDESPTADARVIITEGAEGQTILDEWKNGEATEASFMTLCQKYSIDSSAAEGGLFEGITKTGMPEKINEWLFDGSRVAGDTVAVAADDGSYTYVMYYIGQNEPAWKLNIQSSLLAEDMTAFVAEISQGIEVEDPKGNLKYLTVEAAE